MTSATRFTFTHQHPALTPGTAAPAASGRVWLATSASARAELKPDTVTASKHNTAQATAVCPPGKHTTDSGWQSNGDGKDSYPAPDGRGWTAVAAGP
ncbi:hypothetical protein AF335_09330 [Streptomyces eurocidicus]|uniref:Uncharacterized protein n=1 Tax=Streptomyces eurocidicus TaxID=66423 RepID=A0A2N8P103_STREU|nr:hypothetical protein [Streptomyces eurocidicus]MBB5121850.1 hypothetical protein [Streptomyces eurocidicus]MBF6055108.1 hypothetical protein [Streptomyces eurocidicus]PNE34705.1 hypothetical protein AF335_09330 [Streptomyces eurocidicus]